jgi:hypothetical protein
MAVKRSAKKTRTKAASEAYQQAMMAEGAPVALDLLGLGSTIGDVIRGRRRKSKAKRRAKKTVRAKVKATRARKKSTRRKARRGK